MGGRARLLAPVGRRPCRSAGVAGALLLPGPVRVAGRIFMHGALFQGGGARPGSGGWPVLAPSAHRELARSTVLSRSERSRTTGDRNAPAAPRRRIGIAEAASARHREPSCRLRQRGRARFDGVEQRWRRQAGWGSGRRSACAVVLAPTTARRRSHHSPQRKLKTACGTRGGHEDSRIAPGAGGWHTASGGGRPSEEAQLLVGEAAQPPPPTGVVGPPTAVPRA